MLAGAALLATLVTPAIRPAAAGPADDRFDAIDGPLGGYVVRPGAFGLDAHRTLLDVAPLVEAVDGDAAMATISSLAFPRTATGPEQARADARAVVRDGFTAAGYEPKDQSVVLGRTGIDSPNIYADLPGTECADKVIVIGGHYDSIHPTGPAADDNASGAAGTIELARVLRDHPLPVTVRFASWSYEEVGLVGSATMARDMADRGVDVRGAISLEMIGFTKPDIDPLTGLPGDYLAMVADPTSAPLARAFGAAAYTYTPEFPAFGAIIDPEVLPDILRSDHAAFLRAGFSALMATDTANFRNPNYHQATDTVDSLDPAYVRSSIRAALAGLVTYASIDEDQDGHADLCSARTPPPTTSTSTTTTPSSTTSTPPATGAEPVATDPTYTG